MQHTERTTVAHHRSDFIYHVRRVSRADWQEEWGETDKTMAEEFQNEMYKHQFKKKPADLPFI